MRDSCGKPRRGSSGSQNAFRYNGAPLVASGRAGPGERVGVPVDMPNVLPPAAMPVETNEFVIVGLTRDGERFRPSDWAERLCGVMSQFGADQRMRYSPYVHPVTAGGVKCVVVDARLREIEPLAHRFLENFARDNELQVRPGRKALREARARGADDHGAS